ncbi:PREDICTED: uncharacterized protein LOC104730531 [Camelina sativa]|uniref:Uncharacterized protein LOC104730531 n=1 Tax=Camelina sativa TaxID=90675 RepID=A0ABM0UY38_CAMSA|nr:PREDICTED: uncharacterized protein LOC104730531 [Camelina sativa]
MTSIEARETIDAPPKLQIWNNAAFDDGDSQITSAIEATSSWSSHLNESFNSDGSKENHFSISVSSSLQSSVSITTDQEAAAPSAKSKTVKFKSGADRCKRDIDTEIEEVEKEIGRLSTRLESLRLEKAEQTARSVAIRGRIVPAKFMESQKPTVKFDDSSLQGTKSRRGVSLGPAEIFNSGKRSETVTPIQSAQNRRKSCFFKLPGIEESKITNRGNNNKGRTSLSLSPRSRKAKTMTTAGQKQAATTVGSKRVVKKEEGVLLSIQPKKLFKDDEKNVSLRKPLKPGRVVASRYSLVSKGGGEKDVRKRSLPENEEKENHNRLEKRRASDENSNKSEGRVKKRWEIPSEVDLYSSGVNDDDETPICEKLPKIRTLRRLGGSPRDSGAAKRVAELQSKDRNFTFSQLLRFEE